MDMNWELCAIVRGSYGCPECATVAFAIKLEPQWYPAPLPMSCLRPYRTTSKMLSRSVGSVQSLMKVVIEKRQYALSTGVSPEEGREERDVGQRDVDGVSPRVPVQFRPPL